jgi:hypothetical protein
MIKKIVLCSILLWILAIVTLEILVISENLISNTDNSKSKSIKALKTIGFYSL